MKYFYKHAKLPNNRQLMLEIEHACERLHTKLSGLKINETGISEYNQMYFGKYLQNITATLQNTSYILALSLFEVEKPLNEITLIDYGGGSGIISLLAKELGIGRVVYTDIYDVSCHDAQQIGKTLQCEANHYVCGDIEDLIQFMQNQQIKADVVISFDVIEHIYDIKHHISKLKDIPSNGLKVVHASSANKLNPLINRRLKKLHHYVENNDRQAKWGHKERDTLRNYIQIRSEIIKNSAPSLTQSEIAKLAKETRGLIKQDIEKCAKEYLETGAISYKPDHKTNACDPYTGNWDEHLLDTTELTILLSKEGFSAHTLPGLYSSDYKTLKKSIKNTFNFAISLNKKTGLRMAPYYIICAKKLH